MDSVTVNTDFLIQSFNLGMQLGHSLTVFGCIALFAAVVITFLMRF